MSTTVWQRVETMSPVCTTASFKKWALAESAFACCCVKEVFLLSLPPARTPAHGYARVGWMDAAMWCARRTATAFHRRMA